MGDQVIGEAINRSFSVKNLRDGPKKSKNYCIPAKAWGATIFCVINKKQGSE